MNDGDETCRFLQVWMTPDRRGHTPQYGSSQYSARDRHNTLLHILSGTGPAPAWPAASRAGSCIRLHADANVFVSEVDPHWGSELALAAQRQAYLVCMEGAWRCREGWCRAGAPRAQRWAPAAALRTA
jgi:redox-sensitive bicupin YhaK (pirin superfamily)